MLGLLIMFSFWIAITIIVILPLVLTFTCGGFLAEKLEFQGSSYYLFMILFYIIILSIMIII